MRPRLGVQCAYELMMDHPLTEPYCRINTNPCDLAGWHEEQAWEELARFYQSQLDQQA